MDIEELAADMGPAAGLADPTGLEQSVEAGIAVGMQHSGEDFKVNPGKLALAVERHGIALDPARTAGFVHERAEVVPAKGKPAANRKALALAAKVGPDYVKLMGSMEEVDPESKDGKELIALFDSLDGIDEVTDKTGAVQVNTNQLADLATVYGQISDELSSQYTVGYTSRNPKRDGSWRRVVVRINRPSLTARTKLGYFAPTAH